MAAPFSRLRDDIAHLGELAGARWRRPGARLRRDLAPFRERFGSRFGSRFGGLGVGRWRLGAQHEEFVAWKGLLAGLAGGVAGTLAMTAFQNLWTKAQERLQSGQDEPARASGNGSRRPQRQQDDEWDYSRRRYPEPDFGGRAHERGEQSEPATAKAAGAVSRRLLGRRLRGRQRRRGGQAVHYGFGASVGALYGLACEWRPELSAGGGAPFGAALMLVADELVVPAVGLAEKPTRRQPSTHVMSLAAHLVYGLTCEGTRSWVRRLL